MTEKVRDEALIHAFLDGQLSHQERDAFLLEMEKDPALRAEFVELRNLKDLVRHAYDGVEAPTREIVDSNHPRKRLAAFSVAATLLISLGFTGGWLANHHTATTDLQLAAAEQAPRVILHIASGETDKMRETLDRAEKLLDEYRERGVQIEVVANSAGLNLLRAGVSPYGDRVVAMMAKHEGLQFVACDTAIGHLERAGAQVVLLPRTQTAPSAVEHIIQRMREGWSYVKV
ncbi:MAG TPA: hypothetical protein ENN87_10125 [Phycisphaerales bacterium]|nr:hypothetical protein [Phycisphaerales bacterium]